jgi:hypothetical protein
MKVKEIIMTKESSTQIVAENNQYKKLFLIKPLYVGIPCGVYEVEVISGWQDVYWINGFAHNRSRFVEPSSLILELI